MSESSPIPKEYRAAAEALWQLWQRALPLATHMAIELVADDSRGFVLRAPLEPNRNHMDTAFGGSLAAIATLAGWGVASVVLGEPADTHLVIRSHRMRFLRPISGDFEAVCPWPSEEKIDEFSERVHLRGRGEIELQVELQQHGERAAIFRGRYSALSHWSD